MTSKQNMGSDSRFSRVTKDPRFWEMPEKETKIKIDKRFQSMFHDKKFNLKYTVDKRGRPMNHSTTEDLKRFYDLSDTDEETPTSTKSGKQRVKTKLKKKLDSDPNKKKTKPQVDDECNKSDVNQNVKEKVGKLTKAIAKEKAGPLKAKQELDVVFSPKTSKKSVNQGTKLQAPSESEEDESGSNGEDDSDDEDSSQASNKVFNENDLESEVESEEESEDEDLEESDENEDVSCGEQDKETGTGEEDESESDSGPDLARGKGNIETSSEDEDDDDSADESQKDPEIEHAWRELDKDAPRAEQITNRLAVCNMDWDRLKAKDLLALFNSFKPKGGIVFSVKIYPSEFGKERLKLEDVHGPLELKNVSDDVVEEQGVHKEKLREYQFKRLKYFYAVVECDTPETANKIYEECDGLEFESSCSFVDLRFVPDDVQFNDEPKDSAVDVDLAAYKPKFFTTAALSTSKKVDLTWDETDHDRITALNRPFKKTEILDMDFQAYLASSSEEEAEEEEEEQCAPDSAVNEDTQSKKGTKEEDEQIARYRELLKSIQDKDKKRDNEMEMEVKWIPGLKENAEQMVKNKLEGKDQLTPWEKYLQKQKDKRKMKKRKKGNAEEVSEEEEEVPSDVDFDDPFFSEELKKEGLKNKSATGKKKEDHSSSDDEAEKEKQRDAMALLMMDDVEDDRKHFNYDKIVEHQNLSKKKKKQLKKKDELLEDDFQINVEDTRFQALYTSHLYNVDPSDPGFKKTKAMDRVLEEKARRREQKQTSHEEAVKRQETELGNTQKKGTSVKTTDPALSTLLKSIKNKTQQFQAAKRQKTK
ncbi:ESF1 homolog isoform 2-T2 [Pelodytes ibericus]